MANESNERIKYSGIPDSVRFQPNESETPWMEIAKAQLNSKVQEHQHYQSFVRQFALSFVTSKTQFPLLRSIADNSVGEDVAQQNPEISKFLNSFPPRRRPDLVKRKSPGEWHMNVWCAAFVNWCLLRANIDVRGTATAAQWLEKGTPIHVPKYGCIVITKNLSTTGSSSGHVAFCVEGRRTEYAC